MTRYQVHRRQPERSHPVAPRPENRRSDPGLPALLLGGFALAILAWLGVWLWVAG